MQILTSPSVRPNPHLSTAARVAVKAEETPSDAATFTGNSTVDSVDSVDQAQAARISGFVQRTKEKGASQLRGIAGLMAGQMTGMVVGSLAFAPLAFHYGNLYIATGGAAVTGGALALLGNYLASREVDSSENSTLANLGAGVGALANSLPKFVYPTLANATGAEKAIIYGALDTLPLSGVTSAPTIDVVTGLEKAGASGLATPLFSQSRIFLDRDQMALGAHWAQEVTVHEIGHTYDFTKGVGPVGTRNFWGGGFGKAPFVSDYAGTNRMEDYAEAYAHYHRSPDELLAKAPAKFEAIAQSQQPGLIDQALDRPSVRDAGRKVGTAFERAPYLRNLISLGTSLVSPFQIYRGATNIEQGLKSGDDKAKFDGKMQLASGAALLTGMAPLGLAIGVGHAITGKLLADGSITQAQADKVADTTLAVSTGPVGFAANAIEHELGKAGLLKDQGQVTMFAPAPKKSERSWALGGGFAAGAIAGGVLTPWLIGGGTASMVASVGAGSWLGGMAGAALGLGLNSLLKEEEAPRSFGLMAQQDTEKLTGEDKKLLAKLIAPTVVGGVGGAVLGGMAGNAVGQALGSAVAGAAGGVTGAAVGQYLGLLGGSVALAKGGSKLGAAWAGLGSKATSAA